MTLKRKRPARSEALIVPGRADQLPRYPKAAELATAGLGVVNASHLALALNEDNGKFSGWWTMHHADGTAEYQAYLRPWHEDWFDTFPAKSFWHAIAIAMEIGKATPGCVFEGRYGDASR